MPSTYLPRVKGIWKGVQAEFRPDRLVVSVLPNASLDATLNAITSKIERDLLSSPEVVKPLGRRWAVFKFAPVVDAAIRLPLLAEQIAADERISYAEPSFIGSGSLTPGDPKYAQQNWPAVVNLESAWDLSTGSADVLLAIIDSGISMSHGALDHEDLRSTRYITQAGIANQDYVEDDNVPQDQETSGHGTHVAGIATAGGNSGAGIAGVNWVSPVYIARVLDAGNSFGTDHMKLVMDDLLAYAGSTVPKMDRIVVNLSMGVSVDTKQLKEMCDDAAAFSGRILLCCAPHVAGLSRTAVDYPSAYAVDYDFVICVGATNGVASAASDSIAPSLVLDNYDAVTIFAPGVDVYSTLPTYARDGASLRATETDYGTRSGTSMACPMVAGVASLMWSRNPNLTAAQIIACLKTTADAIDYQKITKDARNRVRRFKTAHRRLNAGAATAAATWKIAPEATHIDFAGVAVGSVESKNVVFDVVCQHALTFSVSASSLPITLRVLPVSAGYAPSDGTVFDKIVVTFAPVTQGAQVTGTFTIKCAGTAQ
ncbi:MAG TPA: S8 family serine peptidase, partial [Candidatus Krumholzibacteria bacterium]|nr:S8 family serine peptidase [Candidatus Krumholzibacteria bacterium]